MNQVYSQINIVFLVHDIHFGGGGERVTINLANYFEDKGYDVTIVSLSPQSISNTFPINSRIEIKYLDINFSTGSNAAKKVLSVFRINNYFRHHINKSIVLGIGNYPSLLLCLLPKRKNIKTIGCQHLAYSGIKNTWAILRSLLFKRLDCIVSLTIRDLPKYKKLNKNSVVIPNSISFRPAQPASLTNKRILFVGRMVYEKGYDILIEVLKKVSERHKDWDFRIIGDGPLKNKIVKQIELSGIKEKISVLGSTKLISEEYLKSSLFLMTSRTEGLPMVLLEAQACGLPIVSFDCETGPSDIIVDNSNGFLIDCYDTDKMVEKISMLCTDYDIRLKFGQQALKNVENFRPESINSKWEDLFRKLSIN